MPGDRIIIDSNILLYTFDAGEPGKSKVAQKWLEALSQDSIGATNLQVLNELTSVVTRKQRRFPDGSPFFRVDVFAAFGSTPLSNAASYTARDIYVRYAYAWWDCLLLASALELGCTHFLSEDLQDGQRIEAGGKALTIVSPFAHTPDQILSRQG